MSRIALALLALVALPSFAQYPDRPVTFLAGFPPGGLTTTSGAISQSGPRTKARSAIRGWGTVKRGSSWRRSP